MLATLGAGAGYVIAQQALRQSANHPQVEMALDAASRLDAGAPPDSVLPAEKIDIARSSGAYVIVVDRLHKILASSATLSGNPVVPPDGVFAYVRDHGEDRITWQPAPGVRSAIVVEPFDQGFVVAGRSLTDTENAESSLVIWTLGGWAVAMIAIGAVAAIRARR